jgi:hypothetical protein
MDGLLIDPKQPEASWAQILYKYGVPAVIALYLVYSLENGVKTLLAQIDRTQHQHVSDSHRQTDLLKDAKDSSIRTEGYLRLLCVNTAVTNADRAACLSVR